MRDPVAAAPVHDPAFARVWTVPNVITVVRFLLIAPICWLIVTGAARGTWTPVVLLAVWASTDWVDGLLARILNQRTRFGEIMDPLADRLGITAILVSLAVTGAVEWWWLAVIVMMDALVIVFAHRAARDGSLHVSWAGKARTAILMTAIVLLVLGVSVWEGALGWARALMVAGVALHVVAGIGYIVSARRNRSPRI
ncbi:MAG: CDP-alcohol phosphatidyltransferase family protein [Propionibacteriaceae bacterium]|nr:CDP-alcohol phosphatidyltransferase family protein [Propionibacteriaceae bacterium]